jgi:hypothetical protein
MVSGTVKLSFAADAQSDGRLSAEERILRKSEKWYLICSDKMGCRLIDYDSSLPYRLKSMNKEEFVVAGVPVEKGELFDDYRLKVTSLFLSKRLRPLSNIEIKALIKDQGGTIY